MEKEEARKAYKQTQRPMGIYRIAAAGHDILYVGASTDVQARLNRHKAELKFGNHRNREMQAAWNSLGESGFSFEVLDVLAHEENSQSKPAEELEVLLNLWVRKIEEAGHSVVKL